MNVLVTGVEGLLGASIARSAEEAGHRVRGLVPDLPRDAVQDAARGCEAVVHAVLPDLRCFGDPREPDRILGEGCRLALDAARAAGARLLVASSFLALGPNDGGEASEESSPPARRFLCGVERAAWLADRMAEHAAGHGLPVVRLYTGLVYGPGHPDSGNPLVAFLARLAEGRVAWMPPCDQRRWSFTWVSDVAGAFVSALHRARTGSVYTLGGDNRTVSECLEAFRDAGGGAPPGRRRGYRIAAIGGRLERWRSALYRDRPGLTDEMVRLLRHDWPLASDRATKDLGYRVTPLETGIPRIARWLREEGSRLD